MKTKTLLFAAAMTVTVAAAFGQAPKTNSPIRPNPASNKQERRNALLLPQRPAPQRAPQATALLLDSTITEVTHDPAAIALVGEEGTGEKSIFRYNAAGNLIRRTVYEWNADTQQWEENYSSGYDDRGNQTHQSDTSLSQEWDEKLQQTVEKKTRYRSEYAYDHLNWKTLSESYDWDWENEQWVGNSKHTFAYTDQANSYTGVHTEYRWVDGGWQISHKEERTLQGQRQLDGDESDVGVRSYSFPELPAPEKTSYLAESYLFYNSDGTIEDGHKTVYVINPDGSVAQRTSFEWDNASNAWVEREWENVKYEYAYNAQGLLTQRSKYLWDSQENAWSAPSPDVYTYTFAGSNVSSVTTNGYYKTEYTYDSQNRAVTAVVYQFDYNYNGEDGEPVFTWNKRGAYERAFDAYGNVILDISKYNWIDNDWLGQSKYEYAYDANGNETLRSYYSYDSNTKTFVLDYKTEQAYDASGRRTMYSYFSSNYDGYKSEYTYDANGDQTVSIYYKYDPVTQAFVPERKAEYTYGDVRVGEILAVAGYNFESNNPVSLKQFGWQDGAWVVTMEARYDWTFDAGNIPQSLAMYIKVGEQEIWWGTERFYWSQHEISGLPQAANSEWRVWIAGGELHIEGAPNDSVQIFDLTGRRAIAGSRPGGGVNISRLPQGVYIVKVGNKTGKFIKE